MLLLLAEEFHDIAPPVDYSLIPTWAVFLAAFTALSVIGGLVWLIARSRKSNAASPSPRDRARAALDRISAEIETINPYRLNFWNGSGKRQSSQKRRMPCSKIS